MNKHIFSNLSVSGVLLIAGCGSESLSSDDHASAGGTSGSGGAPTTGGAGTEPSGTVSISGFAQDARGSPLEDVKACLQAGATIAMDIGSCATSQGDGSWTLQGVPQNLLVTAALSKEGFVPILRAIETRTDNLALPANDNRMVQVADPQTFAGKLFDLSKGGIEFFVTSNLSDSAEASVTLEQQQDVFHPAREFDGHPVYLNDEGEPVPGATAGAHGAFVNLPAALYVLTFTYHPEVSCTLKSPLYGYTSDHGPLPGVASIVVPVIEAHVTTPVGVTCTNATTVAP